MPQLQPVDVLSQRSGHGKPGQGLDCCCQVSILSRMEETRDATHMEVQNHQPRKWIFEAPHHTRPAAARDWSHLSHVPKSFNQNAHPIIPRSSMGSHNSEALTVASWPFLVLEISSNDLTSCGPINHRPREESPINFHDSGASQTQTHTHTYLVQILTRTFIMQDCVECCHSNGNFEHGSRGLASATLEYKKNTKKNVIMR